MCPETIPDPHQTSGFSFPVCAAAFLRSSFSWLNPVDAFRIENLVLPTCRPFSNVLGDETKMNPALTVPDAKYRGAISISVENVRDAQLFRL